MEIESKSFPKERSSLNFSVSPMTFDGEFSRICWYIRDADFFKKQKYNILLPTENQIFREYYENGSSLKPQEESELRNIFKNTYSNDSYDVGKYCNAIDEILSREEMKESIDTLRKLNEEWGFKLPKDYSILLTKYGGSGSYGYVNDSITYNIAQRDNSKNTFIRVVLHEAMHIGIEESIIRKYKLTHLEKERVVDLMCKNIYAEIMPNYYMWPEADKRLDQYITGINDILNLPENIEKYILQNPR